MRYRANAIMTVGLTALFAGCGMMPTRDEPLRSSQTPAPLAAAPTASVSAQPLPPPAGAAVPAAPSGLAALDPGLRPGGPAPARAPAPIAAAAPGGAAIARPDLIGSWTIAAAGDTCQLNMVLTTWTGGYRASTRNCKSDTLKTISAWNLEGQQIQLFNDSGSTVARLFPSSKTQFSGQTQGGGPVTVSR